VLLVADEGGEVRGRSRTAAAATGGAVVEGGVLSARYHAGGDGGKQKAG